jgi:DNA-binding beta-propeller fold protein YncE
VQPRARPLGSALVAVAAAWLLLPPGCSDSGDTSRQPSPAGRKAAQPKGQIAVRIRLPAAPVSIAAGAGAVWALTRDPAAVWRIDPGSDRVVGKPIRLSGNPWNVAVGAGSVWVTPNGSDGRLTRIDPRAGRITAQVSARPVYFGSVIAFGDGFVFTGNDDERYKGGSTVSKLDPRSDRVLGDPLVLRSPQSVAFGQGAFWVADHSGWLIKIDPRRFRVIARRPLRFGAHGVVVSGHAVYVADAHGKRIVKADSRTATIVKIARLPAGPIYPVAGGGSIWSGSSSAWENPASRDDRLMRIDPKSLALQTTYHLGANVAAVGYGFGSVWAALANGELVRLNAGRGR